MRMKRVLVIDQGKRSREALVTILHLEGYHAVGTGSFSEAKIILKKRDFSIVFMEMSCIGNNSKTNLVNWIKRVRPHLPVVIMSDQYLENTGIPNTNNSIHGIVQKPFQVSDVEKIVDYVKQVPEKLF